MGKKNKITGIDKEGSLFSKFTLFSSPEATVVLSVLCILAQKPYTHTGISTGIESP